MKLKIKAGTTSKRIKVFIQDSSATTGAGLTGLVFNTASLTAYYIKDGDSATTVITLVTATLGTYTSGGFKEVDATNMPGVYEIGIPNAAIVSGNCTHIFLRGAANMAQLPIEIELDAVDYQDAVRFGLTAMPNVASGSAGALLTSGTGAAQLATTSGLVTLAGVTHTGAVIPTVTDVATKTGYSLSAGGVQAIWDALTSALTTVGSIGKLFVDNINATISSRSTYAGGDTAGTATLLSRIASALTITSGKVTVGTNDDKAGYSLLATTGLGNQTANLTGNLSGSVGSVTGLTVTNLDATISSRASATSLATVAGYIDTEIAAIQAKTNLIPVSPAAVGDIPTTSAIATAVAGTQVLSRLDSMIESNGGSQFRFDTIALELAPSGGGGGGATDWTVDERTVIRSILGIPGSGTVPSDPTVGILDTIRDNIGTINGFVDTEITAIKAKTDLIPTQPASVGSAMTLTVAYDAAKTAATQTSVDGKPTLAQIEASTILAKEATVSTIPGLVWSELTTATWPTNSFGKQVVIGSSTHRSVAITGSHHVASVLHDAEPNSIPEDAFVTGALSARALAADAATEIATAVSGIQILSRLDSMVESNGGGQFRFDTIALSLAPFGAGGGGDPWSTLLPGSYAVGTAGFVLSGIKTEVNKIPRCNIEVIGGQEVNWLNDQNETLKVRYNG